MKIWIPARILRAPVVLAASLVTLACSGGTMAVDPVELPEIEGNPQALIELAQGITLGDEAAPITILEFADYQCPGCMSFAGTVKPQIDLAYVQTGQAKFVFYDFPLISIHAHAFLAARAARCANDQGRFWEFHDVLFRNQSAWSFSTSAPAGAFEDYAAEVGLDQGTFSSCLRSDAHAKTVTANLRLAEQLGVGGTPTVMISRGNGMARRIPANSFEAIRAVMDELLAEGAE